MLFKINGDAETLHSFVDALPKWNVIYTFLAIPKKTTRFEIVRPRVAGIDVSDKEMMVAYPISEHEIEVRSFGCYTRDLYELVSVLQRNQIVSVAMESTGVYRINLFLLLQEKEFEVYLVNARHVKNVTGRKDDESDAEWIQKLHRSGLLTNSFQPDNQTRRLRSLMRHRKSLTATCSTYINRMQKALEEMNIKIHTVLSDIDGVSGRRIIRAILQGQRDPVCPARLRDSRVKASEEEIIRSLEGFYRDEQLFELQQCYDLYLYHKEKMAEVDRKIEEVLQEQISAQNEGLVPELPQVERKKYYKKQLPFNATAYLQLINGVDATGIAGISEMSALTILSEVGIDMTRWKTDKQFTSRLGLAPNTKISGGQIISSKIRKKKNHAAIAFRMAVMGLTNSKAPPADYYRRVRAKAGAPKAIVATARKPAVIYYHMVLEKTPYNPVALQDYQKEYTQKKIRRLQREIIRLQTA